MWPSISNAMSATWMVLGTRTQSTSQSSRGKVQEQRIPQSSAVLPAVPKVGSLLSLFLECHDHSRHQPSKVEIPECLRDLPSSFSSIMTPRFLPQTPFGIQHTLQAMPKGALSAANPIARRACMFPSQSRQMSTALRSRFQRPDLAVKEIGESQKRTLFGGTTSRSILAHLEETANKNPNSATSQYAFYQALTRANMPAIIVER